MKKYSKYTALLMMCLMLVTSLSFTACNDDDFDTNQNRGGISLEVFGPCPVARGGELRFIGSGLDQINSVTIPGCDDITNITVVSGSEIRVTVPQTALPGKVVLNHANGKITTLTDLTFLEPISFAEENTFSPARVKPGQELVINGEYLNLMKEVCFSFVEGLDSANVYKADEGAFIEHTRNVIKVIVPDNAVTGPVGISDAIAEIPNLIWSEVELEVILPAVEKAIDITDAKPGDLITITGTDLDLVRKVVMPNEDEVEFTLTEDGKITFNLPDNASNGAVCVVPGSGVKVAVANIGMVVPTDMTHNCGDGLRAGEELVIKGVNMDMVASMIFPGMTDAVEPESVSAIEVRVTVPATAWSGDLTLNLKSGETVTLPIVIAHPENVVFAPSPVPGGAELTITGKNLDLVATVVFEGEASVEAKDATAAELKIKVPFTAQTGMVKFILKSGETVEAGELTVDLPTIAYVVEWPAEDEEVKAGEIMKVKVANADKLTAVKVNGEESQYILNGEYLYINLPMTAGKATKFALMSGEESFEGEFDVIPATHIENVIWTGAFEIGAWEGGLQDLAWGGYDWSQVPAGAVLTIYATPTVAEGEWWCISLRHGDSWGALAGVPGQYDSPENGVLSVTLSQETLDDLVANGGLVIMGSTFIINRITIEWEISVETVAFVGPVLLSWGDDGRFGIDMQYFKDAKPGSKMKLYITQNGWGQAQLNDGAWANDAMFFPEVNGAYVKTSADDEFAINDPDATVFSVTLTQEVLDHILATPGDYWGLNTDEAYHPSGVVGMVIQGDGLTIDKVAFE